MLGVCDMVVVVDAMSNCLEMCTLWRDFEEGGLWSELLSCWRTYKTVDSIGMDRRVSVIRVLRLK